MQRELTPRVSIGLPVFNGENYVAAAIESITAQSYTDFELIISDNGSTDATEAICSDYASRNSRIQYYRNNENVGASKNYNRLLELSRGEYFKWISHDDLIEPDFLARCVEALDTHEDAVLSTSRIKRINENGDTLYIMDEPLKGLMGLASSADRFGLTVTMFECAWTEIFGLMRKQTLTQIAPFGAFRGADIAVVVEMALHGRFIYVPEPLMAIREHSARYYRTVDANPEMCADWYDPARKNKKVWHHWKRFGAFFGAINRSRQTGMPRLQCYGHMMRALLMAPNAKGLLLDLLVAIDHRAIFLSRRVRHKQSS